MHGSTNGLNLDILGAVIVPRGNDMAVECAAKLLAILNDAGASANLHMTKFSNFDLINNNLFF
jgi:hypothetical protein